MTSQHVHNNFSGKRLNLPEPDVDNITVLTRNLPNKPILPWHHYDSPWRDPEVEQSDKSEELASDTDEVDRPEQVRADTLEALADEVEAQGNEAQVLEVVTEFVEESPAKELEEERCETEGLEQQESAAIASVAPEISSPAEADDAPEVDEEESLVAHLSEKLGISDRQEDEADENEEQLLEDTEELLDDEDHELKQLG